MRKLSFLLAIVSCVHAQTWSIKSSTTLQAVCPANNFGGISYAFSTNCKKVIDAWSGAAVDTLRSRLLLWGGGGPDYSGNEVYAYNVAASPVTLTRITDPSDFTLNTGNPDINAVDGSPVSRHSYNDLVYIASADRLFTVSGRIATNDAGTNKTYTLNLAATPPAWTAMDPVTTTGGGWDPTTQGVSGGGAMCGNIEGMGTGEDLICIMPPGGPGSDAATVATYTYSTNKYLRRSTGQLDIYAGTCVVDRVAKLMICMGKQFGGTTRIQSLDVSSGSTWTVTDILSQTTGCSSLAGNNWPGLAWDAQRGRITGYPGTGSTVYTYDTASKTCTAVSATGAPNANGAGHTGIFGRWAYIPGTDSFALVNNSALDAATFAFPGVTAPLRGGFRR